MTIPFQPVDALRSYSFTLPQVQAIRIALLRIRLGFGAQLTGLTEYEIVQIEQLLVWRESSGG